MISLGGDRESELLSGGGGGGSVSSPQEYR